MGDFEPIPDFSQKMLVELMRASGLDCVPARLANGHEAVGRTFRDGTRTISYNLAVDGETLKCIGFIQAEALSNDFIVNWNNTEKIAPVILMQDGVALKFDTNIRRSMVFASFRKTVQLFEQAMAKLDRAVRTPRLNDLDSVEGQSA